MVIFYKKWKKYNEIQLTKNQNEKSSKNYKSSTLPRDHMSKIPSKFLGCVSRLDVAG